MNHAYTGFLPFRSVGYSEDQGTVLLAGGTKICHGFHDCDLRTVLLPHLKECGVGYPSYGRSFGSLHIGVPDCLTGGTRWQ